jgi:type II secretory pathway component PulK
MSLRPRNSRRGFATLAVFGVIIVAALVLSMLQATAFSQAAAGRESLGRARAYWAARGGVEATLARLEYDTLNPDPNDSFKVMDDMVDVAQGQLVDASYRIATTIGKQEYLGPADAHAKININRMTKDQLLLLEPYMTEDVADSILDWIDADDDPNPMGAETPYYLSLPNSYVARNGPMKSIVELELVAGVDPRDVRGEDWNLNGLLDPNEDDGDASWPPDNADGVLDQGWAGILTTASVDGGLGASGEARLDLKSASESDIADRIKANTAQATAIQAYIDANANATLGDFIRQGLSRMARSQSGNSGTRVDDLTDEQLGLLIDECSVGPVDTSTPQPGKLNINTCAAETLQYLPEISPELADAIVSERSARPDGFASIVDLMEVPGMTRSQLATIYDLLCVRSNVYVVTCRGRDTRTGLEVEMQATLDRSKVPVVVTEVLVR